MNLGKPIPVDVQQLISLYHNAQTELVRIIADKEARGNVVTYQQSLLKQVNDQIAKLDRQALQWVSGTIPTHYRRGIAETNARLKEMGVDVTDAFSLLHERAIRILARNTAQDLRDANLYVGRVINDVIRQAGLEAISQKVATGQTVKEAKKSITQRLIDEGLNGVVTKTGRKINLSSYAELVARSTTREATNRACLNQLTELGYDLVKISSHATTCPVCAPLQGRVYSISGRDPNYPSLERAHSGGHANIHPNCRHVLLPYIPELATDTDADREFSNRPFDMDPRSENQRKLYDRTQRKKTELRRDRDQYERYKLALGKEAPKTFSGFRSMKRANSERFQELQSSYRSIRGGR